MMATISVAAAWYGMFHVSWKKEGMEPARIAKLQDEYGVKPEDMPRVFDPYFTTKRTGSGLGLAIAKNIIEGMGGSIALESRPGEGTDIHIDLPIRREAHA